MSQSPFDIDSAHIVPRSRNASGQAVYTANLTSQENTQEKTLLCKNTTPLPIIFIPGVMGSNLRDKKSKKTIWQPPNASFSIFDIIDSISALLKWASRDAKDRQELLKAEMLELDNKGSIDTGKSGLTEDVARERGWGSVMRSCYHPFMALLEERLDNIKKQGKIEAWWSTEGKHHPDDYGQELANGLIQLSDDELEHAAKYQFDVWCAGYNWLQSNHLSALDVKDFIENKVISHYQKCGHNADKIKVILVTHSMGGLVARSLTQHHGYSRVLGVVHGVQPAIGASTIYRNMRCGYNGVAQIVLGRNAGEVTSVVAQALGPLELSPTAEYRGTRPWLFLRDAQGQLIKDIDGRLRAYPQDGDPYNEIYKSKAWYGLVPRQNEKYLDMSESNNPMKLPRIDFNKNIDKIKIFHTELHAAGYHPEAYVFYGADDGRHSWRDIIWEGSPEPLESLNSQCEDDGNGSYNGWFSRKLPEMLEGSWEVSQLSPEDREGSGGDETVPTDSGQAPRLFGKPKASFRQGRKGRGQYNNIKKIYEHQNSYLDTRAQWASLYSIIKIAQLAD